MTGETGTMTNAEAVAAEHIAYRRAEGWRWGKIIAEVNSCMRALGGNGWSCYRKPADINAALAWVYRKLQAQRLAA